MKKNQKYIGLLGLGEKTTLFYISKLNQQFKEKNGGYSTQPLKMLSTNFDDINPYLPIEFEFLVPVVKKYILELNELGVGKIMIPNMTLHLAIDKIDLKDEIKDKIVHPFKLMVYKLKRCKVQDITLIGTKYAMQSQMFHSYFTEENISVNVPSISHIKAIDELRLKIYDSGYALSFKNDLVNILKDYKNPVLACTELSIINDQYLDLVEIQLSSNQ